MQETKDSTNKESTIKQASGSDRQSESLTEKEELLLVRYSDNECGFFHKLMAQRLIAKNSSASEFVNSLKLLSKEFAASTKADTELNIDLWSRISNRISQEEKAEFYLGARDTDRSVSKQHGLFDWNGLNVGLSTGVLAAAFALFFIYGASWQASGPQLSDQQIILNASNGGSEQTDASLSVRNVSAYSDPKIDWLRSHAKVRMIRDSRSRGTSASGAKKRLPVIWVSRSLPDEIDSPDINLFDAGEETNSDTPIILKDRSPNTVNVINRGSSGQK